jgi:hypothetical protein
MYLKWAVMSVHNAEPVPTGGRSDFNVNISRQLTMLLLLLSYRCIVGQGPE